MKAKHVRKMVFSAMAILERLFERTGQGRYLIWSDELFDLVWDGGYLDDNETAKEVSA